MAGFCSCKTCISAIPGSQIGRVISPGAPAFDTQVALAKTLCIMQNLSRDPEAVNEFPSSAYVTLSFSFCPISACLHRGHLLLRHLIPTARMSVVIQFNTIKTGELFEQ